MRISELSSRAGVPVATIKFYLRDGLLHHGHATSATQSSYDNSHVERLRLIRALLEVGGLSLANIQRVLTAANDPHASARDQRAVVRQALAGSVPADVDVPMAQAVAERIGWSLPRNSPHLAVFAKVLSACTAVGVDEQAVLPAYAVASELVARADADAQSQLRGEAAAAAAVLGEALLAAMQRVAAEHVESERAPGPAQVPLPRSAGSSLRREHVSS